MNKKSILLIFFILIANANFYKAQTKNKGVAIGKDNSVPSAILDVSSSNVMTSGTGATATATVNAAGQVTAITVTNGGKNYTGNVQVNVYAINDNFLIAYGARATATITNGVITAINVTNGGSNYVAGKTLVSINPGNKAMVLPRVDLAAITNGTTPVNAPKDGVVIYNNDGTEKSGIYFWNSSYPKWDRGIPFIETGKGAIIRYSGSDELILNDDANGKYIAISSDLTTKGDIFKYSAATTLMGLKSVNLDLKSITSSLIPTANTSLLGRVYDKAYCIKIEPGSYKFELSFYLTAPAPNWGSIAINETSPFYYMGYLTDCYLIEYDLATLKPSAVQPSNIPTPYTPTGARLRKEYGVNSKVDSEHRMTQIYSFNIQKPPAGKGYALYFTLGRMSGSGFNDQFSFSRTKSYIKVNKY